MKMPEPAKRRLIQLLCLLQELQTEMLTSTHLQKLTGWTNATIRKDLSYILSNPQRPAAHGKSNGYKRTDLIASLNNALFVEGNTKIKKCCLIGLGIFGQALMESRLLDGSAFVIIAGFDASLNRVETLNAPFPLYVLLQLEHIIAEKNIEYAILSTDAADIQNTAERLIKSGIKGIVNYSSSVLPASKDTKIENLSLPISLQNLAC